MKLTLSAPIYSLVSILPIILFLQNQFGGVLYYNHLYILEALIMLSVSSIIYRKYILVNKSTFESERVVHTDAIMLSSIVTGCIFTLFVSKDKLICFLLAIPIISLMIINYFLSVLIYLKDETSDGLITVVSRHLKKTIWIIFFTIILKILIITFIIIFGLWPKSLNYLVIISVISDFVLVIILRKFQYRHYLTVESGHKELIKTPNRIFYLISVGAGIIISLIFSKDWSLLSYTKINDFLKWLSALERSSKVGKPSGFDNSGDALIDQILGGRVSYDRMSDSAIKVNSFLSISGKIIAVIIFSLIIYLIFKPVIKPLFSKEFRKISLKDYYYSIFIKIKDFILSIIQNKPVDKNREVDKIKKIHKSLNKVSRSEIKKKKEIKKLLRLYILLIKSINKRNKKNIFYNFTLDELFNTVKQDIDIQDINSLCLLFKKGFFSYELLEDNEFKHIKDRVLFILKSYKTVKMVK